MGEDQGHSARAFRLFLSFGLGHLLAPLDGVESWQWTTVGLSFLGVLCYR